MDSHLLEDPDFASILVDHEDAACCGRIEQVMIVRNKQQGGEDVFMINFHSPDFISSHANTSETHSSSFACVES
jgi:formylmethanofuran dehydrogenase subunit E-like metal-binding protein